MKLTIKDYKKLSDLIGQAKLSAILIHGNNYGLINKLFSEIVKKNNFLVRELHFKELTLSELENNSQTLNLFGTKEIVKITNYNGKNISKELLSFLQKNSLAHLVCFISEEYLGKENGLRKAFEAEEKFASIACFKEDKDLNKYIIGFFRKYNKLIEEDALDYLKQHLSSDNLIIDSELEKIALYKFDSAYIKLNDVRDSLSFNDESNFDDICIYFCENEIGKFEIQYQNLINHGHNEVLILRIMIKFFVNLYIIISYIEENYSFEQAAKMIKPPIFYQNLLGFKKLSNQYNKSDILLKLNKLYMAEIYAKTNLEGFDLYMNLRN